MTPQFARQAEDMLKAAQEARVPEQVKVVAEKGIAQAHQMALQVTDLVAKNAKTTEGMLIAYQAGAKSIGDKLIENAKTNTEVAFNAANAMVQAKSLPEVAQMQAEFMKSQMTIAATQFQELFQLSSRVAEAAFQHAGAAARSNFDTAAAANANGPVAAAALAMPKAKTKKSR